VLLAFAMVFPNRMVGPLIPPIPMRAPVFVALYGALELVLGVTGTEAGVAHFAHLGGLAGGFLFMRAWRSRR
jgi:membrane associated rhomboid family serine protease